MEKILLLDGVKYNLWKPSSEDEFEQVVKEHTQEIFGESSIYLDRKQKLKSLSGIGSIPDGYVIMLGDTPQWHIVEMELSSHPLHEHIVSQVARFINGMNNPSTKNNIVNAIYNEVTGDEFLKLRLKKAIEPGEIYKFLSDLLSKPPVLTIIIEKETEELREAISTLAHPEIKVVEFQTLTREGAEAVHAHLFEPLYSINAISPPKGLKDMLPELELLHFLTERELKTKRFRIPRKDKSFFPPALAGFEFIIGSESVKTNGRGKKIKSALVIQKNLKNWFNQHTELKPGDKVVLKVIEPMKKYRLEIVK